MEFTKKLSLAKPLISDTFKTWLQAHNDNADAIDERFQKEANYVTEEGDQDLWHYRKWADGTCEAWCKKSYDFNLNKDWLPGYIYDERTLSFPFTLSSTTPPLVLLTANSEENLYWVHSRRISTTYVMFYIFGAQTVSQFPGAINCYVRGKLA